MVEVVERVLPGRIAIRSRVVGERLRGRRRINGSDQNGARARAWIASTTSYANGVSGCKSLRPNTVNPLYCDEGHR